MLGFVTGLLYSNAGEWFIHRYLLHDRGRKKDSLWSFHGHEHHRESRKNGFVDEHYKRPLWRWNSQSKEALGILGLGVLHAPLFPLAPTFTAAVWFSAFHYYRVHKKSHLDPEWARRHLPWHYDHHMGPNQNANWCVSWPWFDYIMGTREPYTGTERERRDRSRRVRKASEQGPFFPAPMHRPPNVAATGLTSDNC